MNAVLLAKIEKSIRGLSLTEQLCLMERLARRIRESAQSEHTSKEGQLAAMASDPEIQRELQKIDEEFSSTESDGLGIN